MPTAQSSILQQYHEPMWGRMDRALRNCFVGAAFIGLGLLIAVFVAPVPPPKPASVTDVPERLARLILKPKPVAPTAPPGELPALETPKIKAPAQPEIAKPKPTPRRRTSKPKVTENKGTRGRQKAQKEVTQNLAEVSGSLNNVLDNLSKSLPASEKPGSGEKKTNPRRRRGVRSGRTSRQLSTVSGVALPGQGGATADVSGSAIQSEGISIAAITDLIDVPEPGAAGSNSGRQQSGSGGSAGGELRSNESLLAVVRRYAPGIQFCYDNELKKNPGLRGKLAVNITVLADGTVSDVFVVENSLKSPAVTNCVIAQIRGWQFPTIPHGATSFKTPFVFTPPG